MNIDVSTKQDLVQMKNEILEEIRLLLGKHPRSDDSGWLRSAQVRRILNISPGTLQNLRIRGKIRFTKLGGSFFYKLSDIEMALTQNSLKSEQF